MPRQPGLAGHRHFHLDVPVGQERSARRGDPDPGGHGRHPHGVVRDRAVQLDVGYWSYTAAKPSASPATTAASTAWSCMRLTVGRSGPDLGQNGTPDTRTT